jgi:nucleoside-diphosphate-sugar epimerase
LKKIAILGATGHIAKNLIYYFSNKENYKLFLFARSETKLNEFLKTIVDCKHIKLLPLKNFNNYFYDIVINCVGIKSNEAGRDFLLYFKITEKFDNLILNYLLKNNNILYINFSSGAVYSTDFKKAVNKKTKTKLEINNILTTDFYKITKINSEAKHRSLNKLNIVDIRIFSYFSRFIDISSNYFICDLIKNMKNNIVFQTSPENIVRDYIHPYDLFSLVQKIIEKKKINDVFDAYSKKPISKFEILEYFKNKYNLKYEVLDNFNNFTLTGFKEVYCSKNFKAKEIGYSPEYTSLDCITMETDKIFK